jgi:CheY-like chemotaxis protein
MAAERVVLLVDDDHAVLETMQMLLESRGGFEVHAAVGRAGCAMYLARLPHIDVIVADVILAGTTTGIEVCELARQQHPDVGLVVISADSRADAMTLPPRSIYLRKPFGGDDLVTAITQSCQRTPPSVLASTREA